MKLRMNLLIYYIMSKIKSQFNKDYNKLLIIDDRAYYNLLISNLQVKEINLLNQIIKVLIIYLQRIVDYYCYIIDR